MDPTTAELIRWLAGGFFVLVIWQGWPSFITVHKHVHMPERDEK